MFKPTDGRPDGLFKLSCMEEGAWGGHSVARPPRGRVGVAALRLRYVLLLTLPSPPVRKAAL